MIKFRFSTKEKAEKLIKELQEKIKTHESIKLLECNFTVIGMTIEHNFNDSLTCKCVCVAGEKIMMKTAMICAGCFLFPLMIAEIMNNFFNINFVPLFMFWGGMIYKNLITTKEINNENDNR